MTTRRVSADELEGLLDARRAEALRHGGGLALASDGDGTLWTGDVGDALFEHALAERALRDEARAALAAEAGAHNIDASGDANHIGRALFAAERAGAYPRAQAYSMMAWAFAGHTEADLDALSEVVLDRFGFEAARRPAMLRVVAWCDRQRVPMWLVSASPLCVARAAARRMGIPGDRVVAMTPRIEGGVVVPELGARPTYGAGKLERLRERTDAVLLAAFGDSDFDAALLGAAALAVAVHPSAALLRHLVALDTAVVLEEG